MDLIAAVTANNFEQTKECIEFGKINVNIRNSVSWRSSVKAIY